MYASELILRRRPTWLALAMILALAVHALVAPPRTALAQPEAEGADAEDAGATADDAEAADAGAAAGEAAGEVQPQRDPPTEAEIAQAQELIETGRILQQEGEEEAALEEFRSAYELVPATWSLAEVAFAEYRTGYLVEAEEHLMQVLSVEGDPWVEDNREAIQAYLDQARTQLGSLVITGGEPGARVLVFGQERGTLPLDGPIRVAADDSLIVQIEGNETGNIDRTLAVSAGETSTITLPEYQPVTEENLDEVLAAQEEEGGATLEQLEAEEEEDRAPTKVGPGTTLIVIGTTIFVASFVASPSYGYIWATDSGPNASFGEDDNGNDRVPNSAGEVFGWSLVPVAGPFIAMGYALSESPGNADENLAPRAQDIGAAIAFAGIGAAQIAGIVIALIGWAVGDPEDEDEDDDTEEGEGGAAEEDEEGAAEVSVLPVFGPSGGGVHLRLSF
ncbi:MAG: hypothetical protein ACFCGT_25120 [Sandaracinaceae bacterium]